MHSYIIHSMIIFTFNNQQMLSEITAERTVKHLFFEAVIGRRQGSWKAIQ